MGSFSRWLDPLKPAYLIGFTLPDWLALLRENRWDVDARYLPRAVMATLGTAVTSCLKLVEDRIPLDPIDESTWRRPVFVLGLPPCPPHTSPLSERDSLDGANQGRARDATREEVHGGADHWEAS